MKRTIISCDNDKAEIDFEGVPFSVNETIKYEEGRTIEIVVRPESILVGEAGFMATVTKSVNMGKPQDYKVKFGSYEIEISDNIAKLN